MNHTCRICANAAGNGDWLCREKMFGWGDPFTYFLCSQCGCLQIADIPKNQDRYYPPEYYSFRAEFLSRDNLKSRLAATRDRAAATGTGWLGRLLATWVPAREDVASLARVPARPEMRILDVGCGRGNLLRVLRRAGFHHLTGVDPFLAGDMEIEPGLPVRKCELKDVNEQFDLIMLHHVFEHLEFPGQTLADCVRRLAPGGKILLRHPTVESAAWEIYRENWVQLDAPRHFFLHTRKSLELLAERAGLQIEDYRRDSGSFQFWASELYRQGIPLAQGSVHPQAHFSRAQWRRFSRQARELNAANRGDQCVAVLKAKR